METIFLYLKLGFTHVIPLGFDHVLFILTLFFLNSRVKSILIQCTVFTIAHSVSLALTSLDYIIPNVNFVEILIALSILFTAIENIVSQKVNPSRIVIIFCFGIIHGMGFANALKTFGLPKKQLVSTLLSFNVGVEFGQLTVILFAYFFISKWFSQKKWYKERIVYPISSIIGCVALYWTIQRILFVI